MASVDPPIGALVSIPAGRGLVRFCGTTSFAPGRWVGIELDQEAGKNDGTINGVPYFRCRPNYGVFVRPSQVTTIEAHPEPPKVRVARLQPHCDALLTERAANNPNTR